MRNYGTFIGASTLSLRLLFYVSGSDRMRQNGIFVWLGDRWGTHWRHADKALAKTATFGEKKAARPMGADGLWPQAQQGA